MENTTRHSDEVLVGMLRKAVNRERQRRIASGFEYMGKEFDYDSMSASRIYSASTLAGFALINGAKVGDHLWNGSDPFTWIAKDNSLVLMDAHECFAFGRAAAEHERQHIFAAVEIKDDTAEIEGFPESAKWPSASN